MFRIKIIPFLSSAKGRKFLRRTPLMPKLSGRAASRNKIEPHLCKPCRPRCPTPWYSFGKWASLPSDYNTSSRGSHRQSYLLMWILCRWLGQLSIANPLSRKLDRRWCRPFLATSRKSWLTWLLQWRKRVRASLYTSSGEERQVRHQSLAPTSFHSKVRLKVVQV